jgi:hypothetical protein
MTWTYRKDLLPEFTKSLLHIAGTHNGRADVLREGFNEGIHIVERSVQIWYFRQDTSYFFHRQGVSVGEIGAFPQYVKKMGDFLLDFFSDVCY